MLIVGVDWKGQNRTTLLTHKKELVGNSVLFDERQAVQKWLLIENANFVQATCQIISNSGLARKMTAI